MWNPSDSAQTAFAVTPSDTTTFSQVGNQSASDASNGIAVPKAVYVGTGGNLAVKMVGGQTVTLSNVPSGAILPIQVTQVKSTNTTASNIVGWW